MEELRPLGRRSHGQARTRADRTAYRACGEAAFSRVYDYLLGGKHHYAVDRDASRAMIEAVPEILLLAKANRSSCAERCSSRTSTVSIWSSRASYPATRGG